MSASAADDVAYSDTLTGAHFLEFLRERPVLIDELLGANGSIYVHIDYKIGHYVKVIMDEVFGAKNFRNDITRIKCNPKNFARKGYGNVKDMILFYAKGRDFCWNEPVQAVSEADILRLFPKVDASGRRYTTTPLHAPGETRNGETGQKWKGLSPPRGWHWRHKPAVLDELDERGLIEWSSSGNPRKIIYADEATTKGKRLQDIWEFKDPRYPRYPTEKSIDLLRTIIRTSSRPGDLVMDCFCGSGTTLVAAQELGRRWIGIDQSRITVEICRSRLDEVRSNLLPRAPDYVCERTDSACAIPPLGHGTRAKPTSGVAKCRGKSHKETSHTHIEAATAAPPEPHRLQSRRYPEPR